MKMTGSYLISIDLTRPIQHEQSFSTHTTYLTHTNIFHTSQSRTSAQLTTTSKAHPHTSKNLNKFIISATGIPCPNQCVAA